MLDERMLVAWIGDAEREKNGEKCELLTAGSDKGLAAVRLPACVACGAQINLSVSVPPRIGAR